MIGRWLQETSTAISVWEEGRGLGARPQLQGWHPCCEAGLGVRCRGFPAFPACSTELLETRIQEENGGIHQDAQDSWCRAQVLLGGTSATGGCHFKCRFLGPAPVLPEAELRAESRTLVWEFSLMPFGMEAEPCSILRCFLNHPYFKALLKNSYFSTSSAVHRHNLFFFFFFF